MNIKHEQNIYVSLCLTLLFILNYININDLLCDFPHEFNMAVYF